METKYRDAIFPTLSRFPDFSHLSVKLKMMDRFSYVTIFIFSIFPD